MSDSPTIVQIANVYYQDMLAWTRGVGGACFFARDPVEPYEILSGMGPNDFRLVVNWEGDAEFGGNVMSHLDRHTISVWIARTRGLAADRDEQLLKGSAGLPALLDLVEQAKQRLLEIRFPREISRKYTAYVGTKAVVTPQGIPMSAYQVSVSIDVAGREIVYRDIAL